MRMCQFSVIPQNKGLNETYTTVGTLRDLLRCHKENSTDVFLECVLHRVQSVASTEPEVHYLQL